MEIVVVLISVKDFSDGRKIANQIENTTFKNIEAIRLEIDKINETPKNTFPDVWIYPLTDFADECNDENIDLNRWWVSYAKVKKTF